MSELDPSALAVLRERARQLARPLGGADQTDITGEKSVPMLVARLGDERVGIALDHVIEVHRTVELTPIPGARSPVVGAIPWRGRVLTVLDIAHTRRGPIAMTDTTRILVIGERSVSFGIVADDVEDVLDVKAHEAAAVEDASAARRDFVRGVTADALVVLDAAALTARFAPTQHSTGSRE